MSAVTDQPPEHRQPASDRGWLRVLLTFFVLLAMAAGLYGTLWWLDFAATGSPHGPLDLITHRDARDAMTNMAEITVGILAVALTVVAIVVQLAAARYTSRIAELFVRDPVNILTTVFLVLTVTQVIWTDMSLFADPYPRVMVATTVAMMSLAVLILLPYFTYVFRFLAPDQVIARIRRDATDALDAVSRRGAPAVDRARTEMLTGIDQLADMVLNAVKGDEKAVAVMSLRGLAEMATAHIARKGELTPAWFRTDPLGRGDADFVTLDPRTLALLEEQHGWVEAKILRAYQTAYHQALHRIPDVNHLIAIFTRQLGESAARSGDAACLRLCNRFLNTFARDSISSRDFRSAYHVLFEYKRLALALVDLRLDSEVIEVASRLRFYGRLALASKGGFVLETAAHDLCDLLQHMHATGSAAHDAVLDIFLDLDREPEDEEAALVEQGVRRAQVKLATYYLARGEQECAERIADDMRGDRTHRLRAVRDELYALVDPEWWEISNREVNWDYLPPDQRAFLLPFFAGLGVAAPRSGRQGHKGTEPG
ncbi:MAG: DUF2254 domain-containing protein [Deltaproteobacteria bacterium]|nr:DUF2254 domain-containing protein [Deltaproteobacteria bacterium]MCB9787048.1 DUF2254 domain-containing protein [Deltaproteobacteria bacterium]